MIVYIVTEKRENYERSGGHAVKLKLEAISRTPCLVQFYEDVRLEQLGACGVRAVVFSGYGTPLEQHSLDSFRGIYEVVRAGDLPIIGFCGGHQLIAELWSPHNDNGLTRMSSYAIRRLCDGEPDLSADYNPGQFKEWGFYPIRIVRPDPLFEGVPSPFMASEKHMCEVKVLPEAFELLASTDAVRVQAYRHKSKPIYGTQFHCESWTEHYPHGKRVIENFFRIAGIL